MLDLELLRFHDRLSLRRRELIEDGVGGSSGLGNGGGDFPVDVDFAGFAIGGRGPDGFCGPPGSKDVSITPV